MLCGICRMWRCRSRTQAGTPVSLIAAALLLSVFGDPVNAASQLPGAPPQDADLVRKLDAAWKSRPSGYSPRTRHLTPGGEPQYTNRLFLESSPYLLQHAHNPVDWRPWGQEAFEKARKLGRPVLLSVGYSTCHWCHVMEEESFEDIEIARYLNENYVAIKVDREERPDVDAIYMSAVQALTGGGGWPMNVWLTPERKPFYGGTYYPPRDGDRGVRMGFLTLLGKLNEAYTSQPERIAESSAEITKAIERSAASKSGSEIPTAAVLHKAARSSAARFDPANGGNKGRPKFPSGLPQRLLLRYHRRTGDAKALTMATLTLEKMAQGGIYDHIGGGFHRYSTDDHWLVPHFEKMLYDNALLAIDYLEAFQATGREDFARVAREILRYVERDMTSKNGAFYSATDADSPRPDGKREEGRFFTWTPAEIELAAGKERAKLLIEYYAVTEKGNFEGRNILHTPVALAEVAAKLGYTPEKARTAIDEAREMLYAARGRRPAPLRDEKILTSWNGLMISAYARAALVLGDQRDASRAGRAASFILRNLRRDGRLLRSYKDGAAREGQNGYLDDYAFLAAGLLDLYEATGNPDWLREAIALDAELEKHYEDQAQGGFFLTSDDHEQLLVREKPHYDGAEPSGNSVTVLNLLRLHEFTTEDRYRLRADRALRAFREEMMDSPLALSEMLLAVDFRYDTPKEIVIVTPNSRERAEPLLEKVRAAFLPNRILIVASQGSQLASVQKLAPLMEGKTARQGKATAYVCEHRVCELPTSDPGLFAKQIGKIQPLPE